MSRVYVKWTGLTIVGLAGVALAGLASDSDLKNVITGNAAFVSYKDEKPGT